MNLHASLRAFARNNPYAAIVALAVMMVSSLAFVETSGVLPLEGQATPMYGTLKIPGASSRASSSARSAEKRVTSRRAAASQASLRGAAASSIAAKAWTGKECAGSGSPSAVCIEKMRAALQGDMACLTESDCYDEIRYCSSPLKNGECDELKIRRWAYDALFPGCATDECAADVTALVKEAPKELAQCLSSTVCRELLADFRRGEFACRRYEPCLDALASVTRAAWCDASPWCKNMKTIDARYTKYATKCVDGPTAECKKAIFIDAFASKVARRVPCDRDSECRDDADGLAAALVYGNMDGKPGRAVECFLWPQCKISFDLSLRWACDTVKREPDCGNHKVINEYLTKTRPACVFGYTKSCKSELEALLK